MTTTAELGDRAGARMCPRCCGVSGQPSWFGRCSRDDVPIPTDTESFGVALLARTVLSAARVGEQRAHVVVGVVRVVRFDEIPGAGLL